MIEVPATQAQPDLISYLQAQVQRPSKPECYVQAWYMDSGHMKSNMGGDVLVKAQGVHIAVLYLPPVTQTLHGL